MSASRYVTLCATLKTQLQALAGYSGLVVTTQLMKADRLPDLSATNYAIVIAPAMTPIEERIVSVRTVQFWYYINLYLLVKNFDEVNALYGTTAGALGLFQLIEDMKTKLRGNSALETVLSFTYEELAGRVTIDQAALPGTFDSGEYPFVHRALQPYIGRDNLVVCS